MIAVCPECGFDVRRRPWLRILIERLFRLEPGPAFPVECTNEACGLQLMFGVDPDRPVRPVRREDFRDAIRRREAGR